MPQVWSSLYATLVKSGAIAHFPVDWYDHSGCGQCGLCRQDREAQLTFTNETKLCTCCTSEMHRLLKRGPTEVLEVRPVIALLLKLKISADGDNMSSLQIRHAGGATVGSASGDAAYYEMKVYTHESTDRVVRQRLAQMLTCA